MCLTTPTTRNPEPSVACGLNTANVATAMYTINNATIFTVVTGAAVGSVDPSCMSDVCSHRHRRQERSHVKSSVVQTWIQQRLIKFPVAHVSFVGDLDSVVQNSAQLLWYLVVVLSMSFGCDCLLATQTSVIVETSGGYVQERAK